MSDLPSRLLEPVGLTEGGRPVLGKFEVELQLCPGISIEFEDGSGATVAALTMKNGLLYLTTHRLLWVDETGDALQGRRAVGLPLAAVASVRVSGKSSMASLFSSSHHSRLHLSLWTLPGGVLSGKGAVQGAVEGGRVALAAAGGRGAKKGEVDVPGLMAKVQETMAVRAWLSDPPEALPGAPPPGLRQTLPAGGSRFNPAMAGVSGILRREEAAAQQVEQDLQEAFSDLNALMSKAREMVLLAERMRAKLLAPREGSVGGSSGGSAGAEAELGGSSPQEVQDLLVSVGIASPVTRESAGSLYHKQLSRQLADFIKVPLERAGGLLAVVDAYCMFNRARGTELISPEDMLQACAIWDSIDVPYHLHRFDTSVLVIQAKSRQDDELIGKLVELAKGPSGRQRGLDPGEASHALGLAPALAKEELMLAENRGFLCRDDSAEGLRWYINLFPEFLYPEAVTS